MSATDTHVAQERRHRSAVASLTYHLTPWAYRSVRGLTKYQAPIQREREKLRERKAHAL